MRFKDLLTSPLQVLMHILVILGLMGLFAAAAHSQSQAQSQAQAQNQSQLSPSIADEETETGLSDSLAEPMETPLKIIGFGDSLMAGYLLPAGDAFPQQLELALDGKGYNIFIDNAGVSGDTTSGGLARLDWSVPEDTDLVILELGANDALRGIAPELTEANLDEMLSKLKQRNISVILAGMLAPPNMGQAYADAFNPIYPRLAKKHNVPLYPFFLDGVTTQQQYLLEDGMHPNKDGVAVMVSNFLPLFEKTVTELKK